MFKKIIFFSLLFSSLFFVSLPAVAQYGLKDTADKTPYSTNTDIYIIVEKVISGALATLAFVFFGLALYAGLRWMTARGDESHVEKAKDTLRAAVIGLIIILAAYALTRFIFQQLNNSTVVAPTSFYPINSSNIG
jgi:hypothetical protein